MVKKTAFFLSFFIICMILVGCHSGQKQDDKMIFRYNEASGITTLDPAFASGQAVIWACNLLYNGLVDLDDSLRIVPAIAKKWEISEDGTTYTFTLRNDVYFHNTDYFQFAKPRKVVAADFVYSLNRIVAAEVASPGAWVFQNIARNNDGTPCFTALNDSTLQIKLTHYFPPFLGILAMKYCSVVPHEAVEYFGQDFRRFPVGTGPFQFQLWKEGIKLVLRKNPHYFEKDENGIQLPYIDGVAISFIVDKQSVFMEFMKGSLDFMSGIEACYKDALLTKDGTLQDKYLDQINMMTAPYLNTEYIGFLLKNDGSNNPLLIKEVRQALNWGFDREKMVRYLRNNIGFAGTSGFVPMGLPSFDAQRVAGYNYNPQKALELLKKAGFPNGKGLPPIPISVSASYLDLCQYIQHELGKIGITITIDVQQAAQQREMMRSYRLPAFRGSWIADYPDAENYLALFYSKNLQPDGSNYTHYINNQYDALFEKSQTVLNDSLRNDYYTRLDSMLMEDAPVMLLYYDKVIRFTQKNISGMNPSPTNMLDLRRVRIQK
ncbi:MAG: ABC transporter substrate-binding protein [Bacteroidales bacterium]|jgi:ABC-type transport system substrate-binding protein|nr:ABC transporter substrate-binding protein [Bacteroidales bacterium]